MTLIIYAKCKDATIIVADKKQTDSPSNLGQSVRKYFLPNHHEYVLSLSGDGTRVDTITASLEIEQTSSTNIKKRMQEIIQIPNGENLGSTDGFLLIVAKNPYEFYHVFSRANVLGINQDAPDFECYGDGSTLAKFFLHNFDLLSYNWRLAMEHLIAIMQTVSEYTDSVGDIEKFGFDVLIISKKGDILDFLVNKKIKINKIEACFKPTRSLKLDSVSRGKLPISKETTKNSKNYLKTKTPATMKIFGKTVLSKQSVKKSKTNIMLKSVLKTTNPIILKIDKSVYLYGDTVVATIIHPKHITERPISLKIYNEKNKIVFQKLIPINLDTSGFYEEKILLKGDEWKTRGEKYRVIAEQGNKSAESLFWRSDFGVAIELDQKVYTWTDKVYVTIVAPDYSTELNKINVIGDTEDNKITISTSKGKITNYRLVETGINTGIFTGSIRLTGFKRHVKNESLGVTKGSNLGPTDGLLACSDDDRLMVTFTSQRDTVMGAALVKWNIGEVSWLNASYSKSGMGIIRVIDPDMNLNPEKIDEFTIDVWSDSDVEGLKIPVRETAEATGIFEGVVEFSDKKEPSKLFVKDGDTIIAEYKDNTLPAPYSPTDELSITGTAVIGTITSPLEKITITNFRMVNQENHQISEVFERQLVKLTAEIQNTQAKSQPYIAIAQAQNEEGVTIGQTSISGLLQGFEKTTIEMNWLPPFQGKITMTLFIWESIDNLTALSPTVSTDVIVLPTQNTISIPHGTSSPGCEKEHRCFIPHELKIKVNQSTMWKNDDVASHTITSVADSGPDGEFDSGLISSGSTFTHYFKKKGVYHYMCLVHPWQRGTITVE